MARPTVLETTQYLTSSAVMMELDLTRSAFKRRLAQGALPVPTQINDHGVRLFGAAWMRRAKLIIACERGKITPFELQAELLRINQLEEIENVDGE